MPQFNTHEYLKNLGQALVSAYGSAGQATTSGLKGSAREKNVRAKLASILPGGVGVGTGCVIDSKGNASAQMDIVLYEKQFCPVFSLENDVCYYPCESVMAVGSIKSAIGKKELYDIYNNIASVRRLNKFVKSARDNKLPAGMIEYRTYLDKGTRLMPGNWETVQNSISSSQIYAFGLGQSFSAKPETMIAHTKELYTQVPGELRPNVVLTINQEIIAPVNNGKPLYSGLKSQEAIFLTPENSLEYLLTSLLAIIQRGITSSGDAFERYVVPAPMKWTCMSIPTILVQKPLKNHISKH